MENLHNSLVSLCGSFDLLLFILLLIHIALDVKSRDSKENYQSNRWKPFSLTKADLQGCYQGRPWGKPSKPLG